MFDLNSQTASLFTGIDQLWQIYTALDAEIDTFKQTAQIDCVKFCKKCCGTPARNIEVSIFEVLPLALYIWQKGEAEDLLNKLDTVKDDTPCVLFTNDPSRLSGCMAYPWRPLLCRLFGFSACLDKEGKPLVGICKELKNLDPTVEDRVQQQVNNGLEIPINANFARIIASLHPYLGQTRYPINQAIKKALEYVGLRLAYFSGENNPRDLPPQGPPMGRPA